jgi:hypothetical protein
MTRSANCGAISTNGFRADSGVATFAVGGQSSRSPKDAENECSHIAQSSRSMQCG